MKFIGVNFVCMHDCLLVYKNPETNRYYCHYRGEDILYSCSVQGGYIEADCTLKPEYNLGLIKPYYTITNFISNKIKECCRTMKEAEERLEDYRCYDWFDELEIREVKEVINKYTGELV